MSSTKHLMQYVQTGVVTNLVELRSPTSQLLRHLDHFHNTLFGFEILRNHQAFELFVIHSALGHRSHTHLDIFENMLVKEEGVATPVGQMPRVVKGEPGVKSISQTFGRILTDLILPRYFV